jgi:hypothetical protein
MTKYARALILAVLTFPDGSVEYCDTNNYVIDYLTIQLSVQDCKTDKIFANGFEPKFSRSDSPNSTSNREEE